MVTVKGDRHGLDVAWGLRTNAKAYVVETSRGHRDERHQEPIVLHNPDKPAEVCFLPREDAFEITAEGLPADLRHLTLYDGEGAQVAEIPVEQGQRTEIRRTLRARVGEQPEGMASYTVVADGDRGDGLWRLHFPRGQGFLYIDGVTRWERGDRHRDHCVWTPVPESWFSLGEHRWMIGPYQRTAYGGPGTQGEVTFRVHNNAQESRGFALSLEFPEADWPAHLSADRVLLEPGASQSVSVAFTAPEEGAEQVCHVRAVPDADPEVTTYATATVRGGPRPTDRPLDLPLVLSLHSHENRQFGYLPDYPVDSQVYFDRENRPHVLSGRYLYRRESDGWRTVDLSEAVVRRVPDFEAPWFSGLTTKVAFDADNDVYILGRSRRQAALLHSSDGARTFTAYLIPSDAGGRHSWDIEQFSGHNVPSGPPPVVRLTRTSGERDRRLMWRSENDLELIVGEKGADGGIEMREPMLLASSALGFSMHSGIPSSVVSKGRKVHVVWGEATDPEVSRDEIPGVPAYVATYDRETGDLCEPVFMSFGPPPNDGHNTPSITVDGEGYLHVVVGTHGSPFQYLRSLQPNDACGGWTEPTRTSEDRLRQTYIGLVCGADNALHLVFRLWRSGEAHLDGAMWAALAHQRKLAGGEWEPPTVLVRPPLSEYGIYYHRLTVDRRGSLFLSYDYWSTMWFYRNDQRGPVSAGSGRAGRGWGRAVLTSADGGDTWGLW